LAETVKPSSSPWEFGDGQEAGTGEKVVAPLAETAAGDIGGEGEAGEVVTREEAFTGEIAVTVEVGLDGVGRRREQLDLGLRLGPQPSRPIPVLLGSGGVGDDPVLLVPLADGGPI